MKAVRELLDEAGFERTRYHEESFSFEALPVDVLADAQQAMNVDAETESESESTSEQTAGTFSISFAKSRREIRCGATQPVLDAARTAGLRLPASCTQGMCGTCKVKLVSGEVDMKHNGGIRQREIDQGMVLLCCSRPKSDLVIDK
jgi:ferredoxin